MRYCALKLEKIEEYQNETGNDEMQFLHEIEL